MRISDWSSDVCSSDLHRVAEPGGIAATAADNFQVVTGQRIVPRNLALIERRAIMPCPDFRAHQSPSRQALSPSASLSVRRSSGGQQEYVRSLWPYTGDSDKIKNGRARFKETGCQEV